jgi:hypothetical protein
MIINFNSLQCRPEGGQKIVCKGERNRLDRQLTVDEVVVDGATLEGGKGASFENVGCRHYLDLSGQKLSCTSQWAGL